MHLLLTAVIAVLLMLGADQEEAPPPKMTCKTAGRMFTCAAANVSTLIPTWRLHSSPIAYETQGLSVTFPAPRKFSVLEMTVKDAVQTHRLRAWVGLRRGKAVFAPYIEGETP